MNIGIIGTGGRSIPYLKLCLSGIRDGIHVMALADIDPDKLQKYAQLNFENREKPELYTDYNMLLENNEIDAVIICTPDTTHREISIAALKAEKHILLEKPLATTIGDCSDMYKESLKHNKVFRLGFVLRYSDFYKKIKEIVSNGMIGRVISVEAKEVLAYEHAGSFFRRWHRFKENNGGFLNAKCSHDLDILNWIIDTEPRYVSAFGSRSFFNPIVGAADHCPDCRLKNDCRYYYNTEACGPFQSLNNNCVFNCDKDIVDHEVVNIEYENGVTVSFTVCMLSAEANRTMVVFGSEATLYADLLNGTIKVNVIHPFKEMIYEFVGRDLHGGGDRGIYEDFIDSIHSGTAGCVSYAKAGLLSSAIALAAEVSMEERKIIDLRSFAGINNEERSI